MVIDIILQKLVKFVDVLKKKKKNSNVNRKKPEEIFIFTVVFELETNWKISE